MNKPSTHNTGNKATKSCDTCHRSSSWLPASWNHAAAAGICSTCHVSSPEVSAPNRKPASHTAPALKGTLECDSCHSYIGWYPNRFKHNTGGLCSSCHDSVVAIGKPASHTPSSIKGMNQCSDCHTVQAWLPAAYRHTGAGTCSSCHDGVKAVGKSAGHIATTEECSVCHTSTTTWSGALGAMPSNHIPFNAGTTCGSCHIGTSVVSGPTLHGYLSSKPCTTCHLKNNPYAGWGQDTKSIGHEGWSTGDCSQSGCHRPLGSKGTAYVIWD